MGLPKPTILTDLDGTLIEYNLDVIEGLKPMTLLPGVLDKLTEWRENGYCIVITTGRPATRIHTERQLQEAGISYDHLLMGLGGGKRILINDAKPDGQITAVAYCIERNAGISSIHE